ncbi:hypothetical protein H5410_054171 [Solanum commersonii]|uniref:Uncharacterized protein n=1 Tax=Solanum commersonii TaxID=4109 RepID=A0A9J5X9G1_SOLCO|nr:hypothetical protein H5410_054171 [Solanum commersonii]
MPILETQFLLKVDNGHTNLPTLASASNDSSKCFVLLEICKSSFCLMVKRATFTGIDFIVMDQTFPTISLSYLIRIEKSHVRTSGVKRFLPKVSSKELSHEENIN